MKHTTHNRKGWIKSTARPVASAALMASLCFSGPQDVAAEDSVKPCATAASLEGASGAGGLVASQSKEIIVAIRPDNPKVGRPVVAWLVGHQPGRLLIARRINWDFNNTASMLKDSGGGSASTIYLTPGTKTISVSVTDLSGNKKTATCSFSVTW